MWMQNKRQVSWDDARRESQITMDLKPVTCAIFDGAHLGEIVPLQFGPIAEQECSLLLRAVPKEIANGAVRRRENYDPVEIGEVAAYHSKIAIFELGDCFEVGRYCRIHHLPSNAPGCETHRLDRTPRRMNHHIQGVKAVHA